MEIDYRPTTPDLDLPLGSLESGNQGLPIGGINWEVEGRGSG